MRARVSWTTPKPTDSFIPKLKEEASKHSLELAEAVWQGAVDRTRVASGELRASWTLSLGAPNYETVGASDGSPGPSGSSLPKPAMPQLPVAPLGSAVYYVSNGKSYAVYEEFGSPTNAPRLMLTRAVMSVEL